MQLMTAAISYLRNYNRQEFHYFYKVAQRDLTKETRTSEMYKLHSFITSLKFFEHVTKSLNKFEFFF